MIGQGQRRVVLTRTEGDNRDFVQALFQHIEKPGVTQDFLLDFDQFYARFFLSVPQLTIEPVDSDLPPGQGVGLILLTSPKALMTKVADVYRDIPYACVGSQTEAAAQRAGWAQAEIVAKNASELAAWLSHRMAIEPARVLYLRGAQVRFDFADVVPQAQYQEYITYKAEPCRGFPESFLTRLETRNLGPVAFFSLRTAEIFIENAKAYGIVDQLAQLEALCLSPVVLECVRPYFGARAYACEAPDRASMLKSVHQSLLRLYTES